MPRHSLAGVEGALGSATVARVLGVHPRTLARRSVAKQNLRPLDAQRQDKLVRIWRELHEIFTDENARRWLEELRHARLAITGEDLLAAGLEGPAIGRALDAATAAMLDGAAPGREQQLAAALAAPPE